MGGGVGVDVAVGGVIKGDVVLTTLRRMGNGGVAQFWGARLFRTRCSLKACWNVPGMMSSLMLPK